MQTMPAKNRTAVAIGVLLGVVVLAGSLLFWSARSRQNAEQNSEMSPVVNEPVDGTGNKVTPMANSAPTGTQEAEAAHGDAAGSPIMGPIPEQHTVATGDTLQSISLKYYHSHIFAGDIEELNNLENPNRLVVGEKLMLPKWEDLKGINARAETAPAMGTQTAPASGDQATPATNSQAAPAIGTPATSSDSVNSGN